MKYGLKRPRSTLGRSLRRAFTLTELLLAIMVVGILASMTIVVTTQAMYSAKVEKTKSTIAKLDVVISEMYENFETRRLPLSGLGTNPRFAHTARLWFMRDMMRMEMPCNFLEITTRPLQFTFFYNNSNVNSSPIILPDSPLRVMYANAIAGSSLSANYQSAKCLYLIITLGNPESREAFHDSEIATDPDDGLSYFIDGWGNPIGFLRWAPGLYDSDRQPIILNDWTSGNDQDKINAAENFSDSLNPIQIPGIVRSAVTGRPCLVDMDQVWTDSSGTDVPVKAWAMVPLIVSSGGDEDGYAIDGIGNRTEIFIDPVYDPNIGGPVGVQNFNIITNHTSRR